VIIAIIFGTMLWIVNIMLGTKETMENTLGTINIESLENVTAKIIAILDHQVMK